MSFFSFTNLKNRRVEQVLPGGYMGRGCEWGGYEGGGCEERVWESEYGENPMYTCM
jgi:hypothetical protein